MVSSITSSTIDEEDEAGSLEQGESFPDIESSSSDGNDTDEEQHSSIAEKEVETVPSAVSRGFNDIEEHEEKAAYVVESTEHVNKTSAKSEWYDSLPSFLSIRETSSQDVEEHVDSKEPSLQEVNVGAADPAIEDIKPPPLAGPNVMNIILVAAECAPWSKTGKLE